MVGYKIMGRYEPSWSAEEQTMVDLMQLNGYGVRADAFMDYYVFQLFGPETNSPITFRGDTTHEVVRKAFNYWTRHNAQTN